MRQFVVCGTLDLTIGNGSVHQLQGRSSRPHARITIHDQARFLRLVVKADLAFGEAYMDCRISTGNCGIDALMELLMLNSRHWSTIWAGHLTLRLGNYLAWLQHFKPYWRSRRNLAHHYDLTDDSVGMLEHVGPAAVPAYFKTMARLLAPVGAAVIHSIAVHDRAATVNRWITRYIFPRGHLPSLPDFVHAAEAGRLKILDT